MPQVELHQPGEAPAADAPAKPGRTYVTDALGRRIGVRKMGPLQRMQFFKLIPPGRNEQYVGLAMLAYSVAEIEGEVVVPPATELQLEAMVGRLGEEGFDALGEAQMAIMGVTDEDMAAAGGDAEKALALARERKAAQTKAAAKN